MHFRFYPITALLVVIFAGNLFAQNSNPWQFVSEKSFSVAENQSRTIIPDAYKTVRLDHQTFRANLKKTAVWHTPNWESKAIVMSFPLPDGTFGKFRVYEAPCMEQGLIDKFPEIRSYVGYGMDDPSAYMRFDLSPRGFHGMVLSAGTSDVFMNPYTEGNQTDYMVFYKKDYSRQHADWSCISDKVEQATALTGDLPEVAGDCNLHTYRLALACTGEYGAFHGGTVAGVLAAMNTTMTRVNGVVEKDLSIHMNLVANNNLLVFLNASTDPYTNNNGSTMLGENQTTCNNAIGSANYDIGHVFSTGGGGVAYLNCICQSNKAGGVTGQSSPIGDPFDIDYVAHEMGHQFGANHTQNNSCNRNSTTAMEPGSASTIMGYAGICAPNVQNNSDAYYHAISIQEIKNAQLNHTCDVATTINTTPTSSVPATAYTIPKSTPFVLTGSGSDPNPSDVLSYCWEQMNNTTATMPPVSTNTGGPAFRSISPVAVPFRYFPSLSAILANTTPTWEVLPSVARTMAFRFTVRDNHPGGGCTAESNVTVTVNGTAGPFLVTAPNTNVNWPALSTQTVTWDVAGTTAAPVSAANVDILLSTDGGLTWPVVLASATPNDGSQAINLPSSTSTTARIMVRATGNIFFDVSNTNFTISAAQNSFTLAANPADQTVCPSTPVVYAATVGVSGTFSGSVTLSVTGLPAGATASFSTNPVSAPGSSTVTINNLPAGTSNFTLVGTSGATSRTVALSATVLAGTPGSTTLSAPANAATGVDALPTLSWAATANATGYIAEVASNSTFTSIVATSPSGQSATSWTLTTALNTNTTYYWRVRGTSLCGQGAWSATRSFTTANVTCQTFSATNVPVAITATGTPTVTSVMNIPAGGTVLDVNVVNLNITHSYINDLVVRLKNPQNTERILFTRICGSQDNININFDDESTNTYASIPCPPVGGLTYKPNQTLTNFDGVDMLGNWTLTVQDVADADGGSLNSWGLYVCYQAANPPLSITAAATNVSCAGGNDGTATVTATGGTGTYTYSWGNGGTTATINGLVAGTYSVTVTSGSVSTSTSVSVTQPTALTVTATATNATGGNNGTASATASGGVAPYSYLWSNGGTTASISGLAPGTYSVTATDANGCTASSSATVGFTPPLSITASATNVSCAAGNDGTATVTATGGTGTYSYSWGNGGTTATITGLVAGTYVVTVTSGSQTTSTSVSVTQPTALTVTATATNATTGNNGTASATASGGTAPYSYLWSNAGTSATISGLAPGTYSVTVTDANGCTATASATVGSTAPSCTAPVPTTFTVTLIKDRSVQVGWTAISGAVSYQVRYRIVGATTWTSGGSTTTNFRNVSNLTPGTSYEFQVRTKCASGWTAYSASGTFTTDACTTPSGIAVTNITPTGATISWPAVPGAISYRLRYRLTSGGSWTNVNLTATTRNITGLTSSTSYSYQVYAVCGYGNSAYSTLTPFSTASLRPENRVPVGDQVSTIALFPNPTSDLLNVDLSTKSQTGTLYVVDLMGRTVLETQVSADDFGASRTQLNVSTLQKGTYLLMYRDTKESMTRRFVKVN